MLEGSDPLNELMANCRFVNELMVPTLEGMEPNNILLLRLNDKRLVRSPKLLGRLNPLSDTDTDCTLESTHVLPKHTVVEYTAVIHNENSTRYIIVCVSPTITILR